MSVHTSHCCYNPVMRVLHRYMAAGGSLDKFYLDLESHLAVGYLFSSPTCFVMGRPVRADAHYNTIIDPLTPHRSPDCWFIFEMDGDIGECWKHMLAEKDLPYVAWEHRGVFRGPYSAHRIKQFLQK